MPVRAEGRRRWEVPHRHSDSAWSFGNGAVHLESEVLRIVVDLDRSSLNHTLSAVGETEPDAWYSIETVVWLMTGDPRYDWTLEEFAAFICERLDEIEALFSEENLAVTKEELNYIELVRANKVFGIAGPSGPAPTKRARRASRASHPRLQR